MPLLYFLVTLLLVEYQSGFLRKSKEPHSFAILKVKQKYVTVNGDFAVLKALKFSDVKFHLHCVRA